MLSISRFLLSFSFNKKDFIYLLLEESEGKERDINVLENRGSVSSHTPPPNREMAHSPGTCTDWGMAFFFLAFSGQAFFFLVFPQIIVINIIILVRSLSKGQVQRKPI